MNFIRTYAKGVVNFLVIVVGGGIAQGLIAGATAAWATIIIGALATAGVVVTRNKATASGDGGMTFLEGLALFLIAVIVLILLGVLTVPTR